MKKHLIFIGSIALIAVILGCSADKQQFNDKNIIFNLVDIESTNEVNSYKIEITNEAEFDLTHLTLDLSF